MVNASIEQIARQNNLSVDQLRQRLMADGVSFSSFREEIRDEITTQRLREREVDAKIQIPESEIDAYLAEQAGFTTGNTTEFHIQHILILVVHFIEFDFFWLFRHSCIKLYIAVALHACTSWNQFTDDYILFQTDQMVNLTLDSSFGQNLGSLLERSS